MEEGVEGEEREKKEEERRCEPCLRFARGEEGAEERSDAAGTGVTLTSETPRMRPGK
jgi:hypothetical protein